MWIIIKPLLARTIASETSLESNPCLEKSHQSRFFISANLIQWAIDMTTMGHRLFVLRYPKASQSFEKHMDVKDLYANFAFQFEEFSQIFHGNADEVSKPVVLNRNSGTENPFGSTLCYGTDQVIVEVMENPQHIAAVIIYEKA
uniref:ABM domain-containing protein n=1 Tax=Steinernema glaseri TaxID=37863 RepID=A0A1I7XZD1_9BILA